MSYRYTASRTWDEGRPRWLYILMNPPLDGGQAEKKLALRLHQMTAANGGGGYFLTHLYCYQADDPEALWHLSEEQRIGPLGNRTLGEFVADARARHGAIVAGWGDHPQAARRAAAVTKRLRDTGPVKCFGQVKPGVPRHPLYVAGGRGLEAF